jgi:hypothetical protein
MPKKLIKEYINPDFSDYLIYGISSHMKDYKLCWHINNYLQFNLTKISDLIVGDNDIEKQYSLFIYNESEQMNYYLLSNYDNHIPWFSKVKHFHYFFIINGNPLKSQLSTILKCLNNIPQILLLAPLNPNDKNLTLPLLTNLELHITDASKKEKDILKDKMPKKAGIKILKK